MSFIEVLPMIHLQLNYGMSVGCNRLLKRLYALNLKLAYKWINNRSQNKNFTYKQYYHLKEYNPMTELKIYRLTYTPSYPRIREALPESHVEGNRFYKEVLNNQRRL